MSLWEFSAVVDGWNRAQGQEAPPEPPSPEEFDDMLARNIDFLGMH